MAMDLAKQGKRVYFLSFEMDDEELMLRMLANMCEIDANDIRMNVSLYDSSTSKIRNYFETGDFPLLLTYNIGITIDELNALIMDLPAPDVVIVDYIQAIRKIDLDKMTTMNNYIMDFRRLCIENNFCGILVSQINRSAMDASEKKPAIWQLKGSGTLEEHADMVLLTHWDYFYTNQNDKKKFTVCIAKNRQGGTGIVDIEYYPEFYKFKDSGEKIDVEEAEKFEAVRMAKSIFGGNICDE